MYFIKTVSMYLIYVTFLAFLSHTKGSDIEEGQTIKYIRQVSGLNSNLKKVEFCFSFIKKKKSIGSQSRGNLVLHDHHELELSGFCICHP